VATGDLDASVASQLRIPIRGVERLVWRDSVPLQSHFIRKAASYLPRGSAAEIEELQRLALVRFFQPSIRLDQEATEAARGRAPRTLAARPARSATACLSSRFSGSCCSSSGRTSTTRSARSRRWRS